MSDIDDAAGLELWLALCSHFTDEYARLLWTDMGAFDRVRYIRAAMAIRAAGASEERRLLALYLDELDPGRARNGLCNYVREWMSERDGATKAGQS